MPSRFFAVVPACGHSARMGRAKLLLPLAGRPLLWHVLEAWQQGGVDQIAMVVRPGDAELIALAQGHRAAADTRRPSKLELVVPQAAPPDMKASIQAALRHIESRHAPSSNDAFLVAPADMPRLSPRIVNQLIERCRGDADSLVLVPRIAGRTGHPVLFSWTLAGEVHDLAAEQGLDAIVHRHAPAFVDCSHLIAPGDDPFADVDTQAEYEQLLATMPPRPPVPSPDKAGR